MQISAASSCPPTFGLRGRISERSSAPRRLSGLCALEPWPSRAHRPASVRLHRGNLGSGDDHGAGSRRRFEDPPAAPPLLVVPPSARRSPTTTCRGEGVHPSTPRDVA